MRPGYASTNWFGKLAVWGCRIHSIFAFFFVFMFSKNTVFNLIKASRGEGGLLMLGLTRGRGLYYMGPTVIERGFLNISKSQYTEEKLLIYFRALQYKLIYMTDIISVIVILFILLNLRLFIIRWSSQVKLVCQK